MLLNIFLKYFVHDCRSPIVYFSHRFCFVNLESQVLGPGPGFLVFRSWILKPKCRALVVVLSFRSIHWLLQSMTRNYCKVWQVLQSVTDKFYKVRRNSGTLSGLKFFFAKCLLFLKTEVILANFYLSGKLPVLKVSLKKSCG